MISVVHREKLKDDGIPGDTDDWYLNEADLQTLLSAWLHWHFSEGKHYPDEGGWLNQESALMEDFQTLSWQYEVVRLQYEANVAERAVSGNGLHDV